MGKLLDNEENSNMWRSSFSGAMFVVLKQNIALFKLSCQLIWYKLNQLLKLEICGLSWFSKIGYLKIICQHQQVLISCLSG